MFLKFPKLQSNNKHFHGAIISAYIVLLIFCTIILLGLMWAY